MKNSTSKDAYFERLRNLADVNKTSIKESKNRTLGTLIDYKRAADGVSYGIVKENHHYFVKKGGLKQDPNISDFAYIGGLANITEFQYKSLAEADKQRNMLLHTINEAVSLKPNKNGSKKRLVEDKAEDEIGSAENKLGDLDAATAAEPAPDAEMAAGLEAMPADAEAPAPESGEELPAEMPAPEGGEAPAEEPAPEGGEELPAEEPAPEGGEEAQAEEGDTVKELEKSIGKVTNTIRKTELEPSQSIGYLKSFIKAFKDKLPDIDIEERKEVANLLTKVIPPEDMADLGQNVEDSEAQAGIETGVEEAQCAECGSFAMYAESRGYGSAEALMECGEEELGNVISGYANAHNDGMNDGDLEGVATVIKIINPEILNKLRGDYGHDEYAEKLTPYVNNLSECSQEEGVQKLNELFGGLKALGKAAGQAVGGAVQKGAQAVKGAATSAYDTAKGAVQKGAQAVGQAAQNVGQAVQKGAQAVSQTYHSGEVSGEVKKLEGLANNLGQQIAALNTRLQKAGQQPVDTNKLLAGITNQLKAGKTAAVAGTKAGAALAEENDPVSVETQPDLKFAGAQSLGGGVVKPEGAPIEIKEGKGKKVVKPVNEGEVKLRKYIRQRLEEKAGLRKPVLTEGKKSQKLVKLDSMIDRQFKLYESTLKKKK